MIFTIDNDNDIRVHETEAQAEQAAKATAGSIVVRSEKELNKAARGVARKPTGGVVEQLRGRRGLQRLQAGHEVRRPR